MAHPLLFSVIVPAYNVAQYIPRCIESVLNQTDEGFELIVVDDGSTDDTLAVIRQYSDVDKRIKVIHKSNGGHTSARNEGLKVSTGEYIIFLDSDDYLDKDTLCVCRNIILNQGSDIVIFGITRNDGESETVIENRVLDGSYRFGSSECDIFSTILMSEYGDFPFPKSLSAKVFKRDIVYDNQMNIPKGVNLGEDGACFIASAMDAKVISVTHEVYYHSLVREGSVSRVGNKNALREYVRLFEHYRENIIPKNKVLTSQFEYFMVASLYTGLRCVILSKCDNKFLNAEWNYVVSNSFIKKAIDEVRFNKRAKKMRTKHWILRNKMFGLAKFLLFNS